MFPDKITIWINELSRAACPPQCERLLSNLLRAGIEQKSGGKNNLSLPACLLELGHRSSPALDTCGSQPFGFGLETHHQHSRVSSLQMADPGVSQPAQLHEPIPYSKSPPRDVSYWLRFSGEPWLIHGLTAQVSTSMFRKRKRSCLDHLGWVTFIKLWWFFFA